MLHDQMVVSRAFLVINNLPLTRFLEFLFSGFIPWFGQVMLHSEASIGLFDVLSDAP